VNEKRIQVPEGMLKAAAQASHDWCSAHPDSLGGVHIAALEAALRWLSENPSEIFMLFVRNAPENADRMIIYGADHVVLADIDLEAYRSCKGEGRR
jgi:hypothetical protein